MATDMASLPPEALASFQHQKEHITDDRRPEILGVQWSLCGLAIVALCFRFYSKKLIRTGFKLEDAWILLAFVCATGAIVDSTVAVFYGGGRHFIVSTPEDVLANTKVFFAYLFIYNTAITSIKCSVLSFYYHTLEPKASFRIAVWCMTGIVISWWIASTFGFLFGCTPVSFFWNKSQPGHCFDFVAFVTSTAIINIFTDCAIIIMPLPIVWRLQMRTARKVALSCIFLLGSIVVLASVMRVPNIHEIDTYDFTYDSIPIGLWTSAELMVGIVGACMPVMAPLLQKAIEVSNAKSSRNSSEGGGWHHTRLEEGRTGVSKKSGQNDEVPLTDPGRWRPEKTNHDSMIAARQVPDTPDLPKSSILQEMEYSVEVDSAKSSQGHSEPSKPGHSVV